MTELETMQRAKMYMDKLAKGIDPITDRELPGDSALNNVRLVRCFFYVSDVLERVIANGGVVGSGQKVEFSITPEQLSRVQLFREPVRITQLTDSIAAAVDNPRMKKINATTVTNWLLAKGFLELQQTPNGRNRRVPTPQGRSIGLVTEIRQGRDGEYLAIFYNEQAQRFVLDNLPAMLTEK